jgi:hypothetical protein
LNKIERIDWFEFSLIIPLFVKIRINNKPKRLKKNVKTLLKNLFSNMNILIHFLDKDFLI